MSSPAFLALASFMVLLNIAALSQLRKLWRGRGHMGHDAPSWWIWGDPLWRGWRRGVPLGIVFGTFFFGSGIALFFVSGDATRPVPDVIKVVFLGFTLLFGVTLCTISLFNRPKALVPPPYRKEPGAWKEWRRKK